MVDLGGRRLVVETVAERVCVGEKVGAETLLVRLVLLQVGLHRADKALVLATRHVFVVAEAIHGALGLLCLAALFALGFGNARGQILHALIVKALLLNLLALEQLSGFARLALALLDSLRVLLLAEILAADLDKVGLALAILKTGVLVKKNNRMKNYNNKNVQGAREAP